MNTNTELIINKKQARVKKTKVMSLRYQPSVFFSRLIVLLFLFLTVYPIIFVVITSLKSTQEFYGNVWSLPKHIEWSNYPKAWFDGHIGQYFLTSSIVVVTAVLFITIFASMAGYALARLNVPYSNLIMALLLSTTMLPSESVIMPLYIMMSKMGMIGNYFSLILPYIGWGLPMTIYILKNFFEKLPNELMESARIDGCNEIQVFYKVMMPLMGPAIATTAIFNFVSSWGELLWATIALSTSQMRTIPMGVISFQAQFATDWGPLSASVVIVLVPMIIVFLFTQKYFIEGITGGAVKG